MDIRKSILQRTKKLIQRCCELNLEFNPHFVGLSSVLADNPDSVTLENIEALRVECLQKLGDANVSSDSSDNEQECPPIRHRGNKQKSRYLVSSKSQERRKSIYDPTNPYTLQSQLKHPFVGHPYAHKPGPHYHIHTSPPPPPPAIMYGEHTIPEHPGGFVKYTDQTAIYSTGRYPVYGVQQIQHQQLSFASVAQLSMYPETTLQRAPSVPPLGQHDSSAVQLSSAASTPRPSSVGSEQDILITSTPKESETNLDNIKPSTPSNKVRNQFFTIYFGR